MKLEKAKAKPGSERRKSTGNAADIIFSKPKPIPNYLRASIGSCHDLCKYGGRRDSPAESEQDRKRNIVKAKHRGKEASHSEGKKPAPLSSRKQQPKPFVRSCQLKQKKSETSHDAEKGKRRLKASKKACSSANKSSMKMMTSQSKIKKPPQEPETSERIISVSEANTNGDRQHVDDHNGDICVFPKQKQKQKRWERAVRVGRVVMKENGSSHRKQKMKMEKALGMEAARKGNILTVEDGNSANKKDELKRMSRSNVKALVDSFENLVKIQHSRSLTRPYRGGLVYKLCKIYQPSSLGK